MREYRALRKDNGEWVYGNLVTTKHFTFVLNTSFIPALSLPSKDFIEVNPETIGQFTGFKDKNGLEIYEGDIVSMQHGLYKYTVSFENGSFVCYHLQAKDLVNGGKLKWGLLSRSFELGEDFELEIIGNIHRK